MIREYREKMKLTQEQLAEKLDISVRHLQRLEYNEENTTVTTLKKIIKVLKISDSEVMEYLKRNNKIV